ncbi:hypothetical protein NDU88_001407 [Pleurodeles waltl]|uniref:Uncharacterized protein n=1 Tax=Pleurodeles waltl TaxID=8319 RepID=A0AAV7KSK8_PLEWA|nr:hypothetical protein NDU88_001407 [Pleurodeles waltl]
MLRARAPNSRDGEVMSLRGSFWRKNPKGEQELLFPECYMLNEPLGMEHGIHGNVSGVIWQEYVDLRIDAMINGVPLFLDS